MPGVTPTVLINAQPFYWADDLPFNAPKNSTQRPVLVPAKDAYGEKNPKDIMEVPVDKLPIES